MQLDVGELREFYATALGQAVRRLLTHRIRARWRGLQGAIVWPRDAPAMSALVEEDHLPLADGTIDRLLAVHCLETAERVRPLLREMWRVLAPEGRMILVVPNRRGVWARLDKTPFGQGRPYSRSQLEALLIEALFTPSDWGGALYVPPVDRRFLLRSATAWERVGAALSPAFSGVIIVEACKELMAPIGKPAKARALRDFVTVGGRAS